MGGVIPATKPDAKVLLYLHGNGINIGANVAHANRSSTRFSVLLIVTIVALCINKAARITGISRCGTAWDYLWKRHQPSEISYLWAYSGVLAIDLSCATSRS